MFSKCIFLMLSIITMELTTNDSRHISIKQVVQYESDWLYFPDGDGIPRFINLTDNIVNPSSRMKRDVEFRLYTKKNLHDYIVINDLMSKYGMLDLNEILPRVPLKIVTHGWMSTADKNGVMDPVHAYLQAHKEVNVIALDWSSYSMNYVYTAVAKETKEVGQLIAQFMDLLHDRFNVTGDQIHLIGHSLGAHVMGIAGFETKLKIGRITGLDPALPLFQSIQKEKSRLDYLDADFVDIIHTCGGVLGFWDAIGNADFYPNNGNAPQPGCKNINQYQFEACSHGRAINYFSESIINPTAFPAYQCNTWNFNLDTTQDCTFAGFMGERAHPNMSGIFYLRTNNEKPFGKGRQGAITVK